MPLGPATGGAPPLTTAMPAAPAPGGAPVGSSAAAELHADPPLEALAEPAAEGRVRLVVARRGRRRRARHRRTRSIRRAVGASRRARAQRNAFDEALAPASAGFFTYAPGPGVIAEVPRFVLILRASDGGEAGVRRRRRAAAHVAAVRARPDRRRRRRRGHDAPVRVARGPHRDRHLGLDLGRPRKGDLRSGARYSCQRMPAFSASSKLLQIKRQVSSPTVCRRHVEGRGGGEGRAEGRRGLARRQQGHRRRRRVGREEQQLAARAEPVRQGFEIFL